MARTEYGTTWWGQQWLQALADGEEGLSLLCGLSAPVRQLQGYPRALSQARQALDLCDTLRPTQRISSWGLSNCCPRSATRRCSTILCTTPWAA